MNNKRLLIVKSLGLAALLTVGNAFAGSDMKDLRQPIMNQDIAPASTYFRANEWSVDLFGAYEGARRGAIDSGGGGGVGVNYFFTKYLGLGLEGMAFDGGSRVDTVTGTTLNFIARYPIEALHLAPYAFVGVGGTFMTADKQVDADGGLGVEWRLTRNWGIFTDGRYVACDDTNDFVLGRLGVRYSF